ncbi:L-ascorbate metabolism protein UlaG (beta-lactamase superfamily) [Saonia flava]|uniref:L-ascorbate metabolism protein UlaG (Beta-lactamase superfamily) n=1 Tax=Saonia flava TaxID=523696 RepID=A0A846QX27_9FLAO|nr:MBL fold metallo-hydrolase [Saonia flava]NJB69664.1 L-ascorbate metabolism protein UlaG (beta-lactamase superfamily) [Saonia flava]
MKKIFFTITCFSLILVGCKEKNKSNNSEIDLSSNESITLENTISDVKIIPIEHATAVLEWGDITIYIDPVGGASTYEGQKQPDLILITDIHGDHLNVETLQALNTEKAKIIVPQAVADEMPDEFKEIITILNNGESKELLDIMIEAIPMYNLREEALNFHTKGRGNGYVLNIGGQRIYFSGDTEDIPEMRTLKNIDKAFICMNLPYTMTEESAASAVLEFKPTQVYPYHFRGNPDVSDVAKFKELVNSGDSNIQVIQLDWYPSQPY